MRTQRNSSSAGALLSLCKVLLTVLALICTLHTASVHGGRSLAAIGGGGALDPTYTPRVAPGKPYTPPRGCGTVYGCRNSPP
uniref:Uncharacterized protein n=1 Tax=Leersia perrieri TaxID=77586 RepID=A0A0D9XMR5_9ORYZ